MIVASSLSPCLTFARFGGLALASLLLSGPVHAQVLGGAESADGRGAGDAVTTVTVTADQEPVPVKHTGREAEGYRVSDVGLGPLGTRAALDTPYQVQTVPQDLIRNQAVTDNSELLKYLPSAQVEYRGGSEIGRAQSRGFEADLLGNTRIDGFAVQSHIPQPIELVDHLDVLNGLGAALYGPMNPAGVFNYTLKRPTEDFVNEVGLLYQSDGNVTERADFGGRIGADKIIGYRVNLAHSDGSAWADGSNLRREVASLALDARVTPDTLIEGRAARYIYDVNGYPGSFSVAVGPNARLPNADRLDPSGYGYGWAGATVTTDYYTGKLTHHFSPDWSLTGGLMQQNVTRVMRSAANVLSANGSTYQVQSSESLAHWELTSNQLYLNGKAETGPLAHALSFGTSGYYNPGFTSPTSTRVTNAARCSVTSPSCSSSPLNWTNAYSFVHTGLDDTYQSAILGDTITLNDQWSVLGVVSNSWISSDSSQPGKSIHVDDAQSYSLGLMFKPRRDMTIYLNNAESVLPGERAPSSGVVNLSQPMSPYRSRQWELGYKAELNRVDLNLALFHIERPTTYAGDDGVYRVQGLQRNQGVELMARGRLTDDITLFGGVTWIDSLVSHTDSPLTNRQRAIGVPEWQANLLAEYRLPARLLPDTTASVNLHYTGERFANAYNTATADAYTTVDLGLRYAGEAFGTPITALVKVNNLFDQRYWASLFPSNIAGDSTTSGSTAYLGEPRTFKAGVTVGF